MNRYPRWLNLLVVGVILIAAFFALPSFYGESRAVQLTRDNNAELPSDIASVIENSLSGSNDQNLRMFPHDERLLIVTNDVDQQERVQGALGKTFGDDSGYRIASNFAPLMPDWLRKTGAKPVHLGLDLRGGVHLLFEVDMPRAIAQYQSQMATSIKSLARDAKIPGVRVRVENQAIKITTRDADRCAEMRQLVDDMEEPFLVNEGGIEGACPSLLLRMSDTQIKERQDFAIEQNTTTLRSRLEQVEVAEPLVQRQGANRIVVQLPGVGDPAAVIRLLSAVATLEFRGECQEGTAIEAARTGRAPIGCVLYEETKDDIASPAVLNRDVIVTGGELIDARFTYDNQQDGPIVNVKLNASAAKRMLEHTKANINKRMGVVFIETTAENVEGQEKPELTTKEEVINLATIRGVFSDSFRISGFESHEAQELAVLLRAGALAAPIYVVEQRTVGPTLGKDNIEKGKLAVVVGFLAVVVFMLIYYKLFGLFANLALFANLIIMVAVLSLLQASLTLPGIAGIVLTVGMAVDANVLIFERIREELRNGSAVQDAIHSGYDKAFSSIADANVTTFIAAGVLWLFGTGPIQGFATTLAIGIASSMFTSIIGTRALVNWIYGEKDVEKLSI